MNLVVIDGVQILVGNIIGHQTIVVVFKDDFFLHGLIQSIPKGFYYYLFRHKFLALVPVGL